MHSFFGTWPQPIKHTHLQLHNSAGETDFVPTSSPTTRLSTTPMPLSGHCHKQAVLPQTKANRNCRQVEVENAFWTAFLLHIFVRNSVHLQHLPLIKRTFIQVTVCKQINSEMLMKATGAEMDGESC